MKLKLQIVIAVLFALAFFALPGSAQSPTVNPGNILPPSDPINAPDAYVSTGVVMNSGTPYQPAPFGGYGIRVTPPDASIPTFVGMRYEMYRDALGKPAFAGMATAKVIPWRYKRLFIFGDLNVGGVGSEQAISSLFSIGGGAGFVIDKAEKWAVEFEPRAQRAPALQAGTGSALLVAVTYAFKK